MALHYEFDGEWWICNLDDNEALTYGVGETRADAHADLILSLEEEYILLTETGSGPQVAHDLDLIEEALEKYGWHTT